MIDNNEKSVKDRINSSPLASLTLPSKKIPPSKGSSLSPKAYKFIKQNLARVAVFILNSENTSVERLCDALEQEIGTLRALGSSYVDEVKNEGGKQCLL